MVVRLAFLLLLLAAGCHDVVCSCPGIASGPGWCSGGAGPAPCRCPTSVPCPGYCLQDGGFDVVVRCDGGT